METRDVTLPLNTVAPGDTILAEDHNAIVEKVEFVQSELANKATVAQIDSKVNTAIENVIAGAPEALDTLKEIAEALTANESVVEALNVAITNKADKADVTALQTAMTTSDKFKSMVVGTDNTLTITFKDGTTKSVDLPKTSAVYG